MLLRSSRRRRMRGRSEGLEAWVVLKGLDGRQVKGSG